MTTTKKRKRSKRPPDKRLKVDVWTSEGLRLAIGAIVRDDSKPATDVQIRRWMQEQVDELSVVVVDLHAQVGDGLKDTVIWK